MENLLQGGGSSSAKEMKNYKSEPLGNLNPQTNGKKPDPYVIRAMNRAKDKIRDRMFQFNGGHFH